MLRTRERIAHVDKIKHSILREIIYDMTPSDDYRGVTVKRLMYLTGLAQSEVSALVNGNLGRFTVDRLLMILITLGHKPSVNVM